LEASISTWSIVVVSSLISPMFESLYAKIQASTDPTQMFVSKLHAVFDWIWPSLFTGSHLGKYGQSCLSKGVKFNNIPSSIDDGECSGCSLAFIAEDFTFYNHSMYIIAHADISAHHAQAQIQAVYICF
jgi:hypothetical protein